MVNDVLLRALMSRNVPTSATAGRLDRVTPEFLIFGIARSKPQQQEVHGNTMQHSMTA